MGRIIDGKVPASQVGALLTALRMKGESIDEITGAARALKARRYRFQLNNHLINLDHDDINFEQEGRKTEDEGQKLGNWSFVIGYWTFVFFFLNIQRPIFNVQ